MTLTRSNPGAPAAPAPPASSATEDAWAPLLAPFSNASVVILVVDREGTVRAASRAAPWAPASGSVGAPLVDSLPDAARAAAKRALGRAARGEASSFDAGEMRGSAPYAWRQCDVTPFADGALVLMTDVTERRREEERLRRAESLLVDAQGVAHLGTWEWDPSMPHASWSPELYRIYGLTPEEYTPSYEGYLKMVHPDDRERVMRATEGVFQHLQAYSHDERIFRKGGEMRWLHTWAYPELDEDGKLVRLVGVCQDVTDFRRAESALRSQVLTRSLARRLVVGLTSRGQVSDRAVRELGRLLADENPAQPSTVENYVRAFVDMGLGGLRLEQRDDKRFTFGGSDLLELRKGSTLPTCALTLGYLEGAVANATGRAARGNEMRCQSMGHDACSFVVMAG